MDFIVHLLVDNGCICIEVLMRKIIHIDMDAFFASVEQRYNPALTIKSGTTIGAGSVVTQDCEDNCLYAGNPARKIKQLD